MKEIVLPSWPIFAAFIATALVPAWRWLRRREHGCFRLGLLVLVLPFLLIGSFAPSRYQYQHHFALIPFLVLGIVIGVQSRVRWMPSACGTGALFLSLSAISIRLGMNNYRSVVEVGNAA